MISVENLLGVTLFVGVAAGLAFGNIVTQLINEVDKRKRRARASAAWDKAWRESR